MAVVEMMSVPKVHSFTASSPRAHTKRLTELEADELRYLWQGYLADLGVRSAHGIIERAMLMLAPPRDVQAPVLEELGRAGGRAPEGRVVRLVVLEGLGTRHEVRLAIAYLARPNVDRGPRVERLAVPRPASPALCEGRCDHGCHACEWTGWDLRLTERGELRMMTALGRRTRTREERWRAADASLEAELHTIECGGTPSAPSMQEEMLDSRKRRTVERARGTIAKLSRLDALVLQCMYGQHHVTEAGELAAVRRIVGGSEEKAKEAMGAASDAYRKARRGP